MVIKTDGFTRQPPKVKSRWLDSLSDFLELSPEGTVEDYLRWCRDTFTLSEYRTHLAERVVASVDFKRMLMVYRCGLGVKPEVIRSMSAKQFCESDMFQLREQPWYSQLILDACNRFSLSPTWQDFVQSHLLFNEGSAGHALLKTPVVDYGISRSTGLVMIAFAPDVCVDMNEIKRATAWVVSEGQRCLYGVAGAKLRPLEFYPLDERYLFYILADMYMKSYNEIISMVKRSQKTGTIDPTIRHVYPDKSEEEIAEFLRRLSPFYLTYEGVHSAVRHTRASLALHVRQLGAMAGEF